MRHVAFAVLAAEDKYGKAAVWLKPLIYLDKEPLSEFWISLTHHPPVVYQGDQVTSR